MKILSLISSTFLVLVFQMAEAKEVMGLNLCGNVSVDEVKNIINGGNASVSEEKTDEDTGEITIVTKDFNVADLIHEVSFSLYKGKLYKIEFKDGSKIDKILEAKYGLLRQERVIDGIAINELFYYNSKDRNVDIFLTYGKFAPGWNLDSYRWNPAKYLCKPIDRSRSIELKKVEKNKQIQKNDTTKF